MSLTDLPGLPESRLPAALAARLPDVSPPAPWDCQVRSLIWVQRAPAPAVGRQTLPLALGSFVDYLDTPVGPYREILVGQLLRALAPTIHVPFIAVDSLPSIHGGRVHWALPKALASFAWTGDTATATGDGWVVSASASAYGPAFPLRGPLRNDQGRGIARTTLSGRGRLARVRVTAAGPALSGWIGTGTHLGVVGAGRVVVGPPLPTPVHRAGAL